MSTVELPRPGIEVLQEFQSTSPTIVQPTLVPLIYGVCRQVVDPTLASGALNSNALISLPAFFIAKDATTGSPKKYTGLHNLNMGIVYNHGVETVVTLADAAAAGLTPASVVSQVNAALATAGVTGVVADVVGDAWRLRSVAVGESETISFANTDPAVETAFRIKDGLEYVGATTYAQGALYVPSHNLPDPRGNLTEVTVDPLSIRAFLDLGTGGSLREVSRTSAFLRGGGLATSATLTGTGDLTVGGLYGGGGTLDSTTLILKVDGAQTTVTFAAPANAAAVLTQINSAVALTVATQSGNFLVLTSPTYGPSSSIQIVSGTALSLLGLTAGTTLGHSTVEALDDGNGDSTTPLVKFYDRVSTPDFTATSPVPSVASLVATNNPNLAGINGKTLILSDGRSLKTITFSAVVAVADIVTQINAAFDAADGILAAPSGGTKLQLTCSVVREDGTTSAKGSDSTILIVGGTAVSGATNYLDDGANPTIKIGRTIGNPYKAMAGDALYVDGAFVANILQVAPGGQTSVLRLDRQVTTTYASSTFKWYIVARNLVSGDMLRPKPELLVDASGNTRIQHTLLRDVYGVVAETVSTVSAVSVLVTTKALVYMSYRGVRKDVSALAKRPGVLSFANTTELEALLEPISTDNPVALGTYFALLSAPGTSVTMLGVDEATDAKPDGTLEAYARGFEFLEGVEAYAIAPLTHDPDVASAGLAHVLSMSAPEQKGERVLVWSGKYPTSRAHTLVSSSVRGGSMPDPTQFDTGAAALASLLLAKGIDASGTIPVSAGVFLVAGTDGKKYSVSAVSGSVVTLRTTGGSFTAEENADDFYAESTPAAGQINVVAAVYVRGASLTRVDGSVDRGGLATTLAGVGRGFGSRRLWSVTCDGVKATVGGIEQLLESYYACAAIAGMVAQQPPQQSFTNFPMTPFTGVVGTNDGTFTERQLNEIAGGGNWLLIQEGIATPVFSRFALTSNVSTIEQRTDSVTKVVDFTSKFLRTALKSFIGRYNITENFLDTLSHVVQGILTFLMDLGVLIDGKLTQIVQDTDNPDTVLIEVVLDVPFPCNFIKLTLKV